MKPSGIGGMAVIEGVMMKNKNEYAIAVRKPNNEIAVEKKDHKDFSEKVKLFKLPIFRGVLAFVDSMVIGLKVLNFSASFFEEEESEKEKKEISEKTNALLMVLAVIASLAISIGLFMVLPVFLSNIFARWIESVFLLSLMEGILRLLIFIGYILLASQMKDIKRVFMYHGAEHKTINCIEKGYELTLENVKKQTKAHKRCGTSFMLLVMLISLVFFVILRPDTLALRVVSRVLLVPVIAGVSYEFIRLAGRSESKLVNILSKPGLWMQALTTKEPDDDMIEVAIRSVEEVFDWKAFLAEAQVDEQKESSRDKKVSKAKEIKKTGDPEAQRSGKAKEDKDRSYYKKKDDPKDEYAVTGEISIASPKREDEEDDEILKALDKYLDFNDDKK